MTTRVALVDLPLLLADVVREALIQDGDVAVNVVPTGTALAEVLASEPHVVVVSDRDPKSYARAGAILRRRRPLGLLVLSPDARSAWLHGLCPCARALDDVTGPGLCAAIQQANEAGP
jgi:hypothetical protein